MDRGASPARHCRRWWWRLGVLVAAWVFVFAASAPSTVWAHGSARRAPVRSRSRGRTVTVALGATTGDRRVRQLLITALSEAAAHTPGLRLQATGAIGASLVLNVHVRSLTLQRDAVGTLVRCDVGVVVADGTGAVRAMLDSHRVMRNNGTIPDETLMQLALRHAMDGAVRNVVAHLQGMGEEVAVGNR